MPGRQSKALPPQQIYRLATFMGRKRLSVPQLKLAMEAPFKWGVLQRALRGEPIWILNYDFIVEWLDKFCPELEQEKRPAPVDGKSAAAGELVRDGD